MIWQELATALAPVIVLIGYMHMRISVVEKETAMTISENEVKEILSFKLENVSAWQSLCEKRLDRIEEALDRLAAKIDQLIVKD